MALIVEDAVLYWKGCMIQTGKYLKTDALGYQPHIVTGITSGTIFRLSVSHTGRSTEEVNYGEGFGTFISMVTLSCITNTEREKSFRAIEDVIVPDLVK